MSLETLKEMLRISLSGKHGPRITKFRIWAYNERPNYGEKFTAEWNELAKKKMMQMMVME